MVSWGSYSYREIGAFNIIGRESSNFISSLPYVDIHIVEDVPLASRVVALLAEGKDIRLWSALEECP